MEDVERTTILEALEYYRGNRLDTARGLQISYRTLTNRLREYREQGLFVRPWKDGRKGSTLRKTDGT